MNSLAKDAFEDAIARFKLDLTNDPKKQDLAGSATCLKDVQAVVDDAKVKYDKRHKNEKVRKWLGKISAGVRHYGNVMDVLVQHHPEYVSLAWGAMKFFFVVSHATTFWSFALERCGTTSHSPTFQLVGLFKP